MDKRLKYMKIYHSPYKVLAFYAEIVYNRMNKTQIEF